VKEKGKGGGWLLGIGTVRSIHYTNKRKSKNDTIKDLKRMRRGSK
jgi:hypothetical protein